MLNDGNYTIDLVAFYDWLLLLHVHLYLSMGI
jgi:hypothetical protein